MSKDKLPSCYGKKSKHGTADCNSCEFVQYCERTSTEEKRLAHGSGHVSYDRYKYSKDVAKNAEPFTEEEAKEKSVNEIVNERLFELLDFVLNLDNYTAELIQEVLHGNCYSTQDLAKKFGVTRQAIHRKLVDCCSEHPHLRELFLTRLYRCKALRYGSKRLQRISERQQLKEELDSQMKLF